MRRPVIIASILALLSACDKAEELPMPEAPRAPLTALSASSTVLFQVYGAKEEPRLLPLAVADGGHLAPLSLDGEGWRLLDSVFFAKGAKMPIYRNGAETGTVEIVRGMMSDEGELYSLPGCTSVIPQAVGRLAVRGNVEAAVEYLASTTPLTQPKEERRLPKDAETRGRSLARTVAEAKEVGAEELSALEFIGRWLPTGAGPSGLTLMGSFVDPIAGDAGPGAGHSVMVLALAEDSAGTAITSYQHVSAGEARTVVFQRLLNHADLDGDGIDELLIEESTYAGRPEFVVLKHAGGKWRGVFRISQDWCLDAKKPD